MYLWCHIFSEPVHALTVSWWNNRCPLRSQISHTNESQMTQGIPTQSHYSYSGMCVLSFNLIIGMLEDLSHNYVSMFSWCVFPVRCCEYPLCSFRFWVYYYLSKPVHGPIDRYCGASPQSTVLLKQVTAAIWIQKNGKVESPGIEYLLATYLIII